jgi:murein DD-endopeptidase MepM/ murein hydrolase activator NlpD
MLLRKYHIVVFKDNEGVCKKLYVRGWVFFAVAGLLVSLVAGNIHFWSYFGGYKLAQSRLAEKEKTVEEQKNQLVSLSGKLRGLEKDVARVRDFDAKLRVMINLDAPAEATTSVGGQDSSFAKNYLPIHRQELLARKMHTFLGQLASDAQLEEARQEELFAAFKNDSALLTSRPTIWPAEGWVSSGFGRRISPFTGQPENHLGLDISGRVGAPVVAPAQAVVSFSGVDGGNGNSIILTHGSGLTTHYAHLQNSVVKEGDVVRRGDLIGYLGASGRTTGPHLHYEVRLNGVAVNPMRYILN